MDFVILQPGISKIDKRIVRSQAAKASSAQRKATIARRFRLSDTDKMAVQDAASESTGTSALSVLKAPAEVAPDLRTTPNSHAINDDGSTIDEHMPSTRSLTTKSSYDTPYNATEGNCLSSKAASRAKETPIFATRIGVWLDTEEEVLRLARDCGYSYEQLAPELVQRIHSPCPMSPSVSARRR